MRLEAGITEMPEYVQAEGVEAVLDRVADLAGATSVTTSPYVVAVAPEGIGSRRPTPRPGGSVCLTGRSGGCASFG